MIVRRRGVGEVIPSWAVGAYTYTPPPGGGVQMGTAAHAALLAADPVRYSYSSGGDRAAIASRPVAPVRAAIARRYPVAAAVNYRRRPGMGDVNEDSEKALQAAGFKNVDCKFVPYQGPFGGGTNVCDVDGDNAGYAYGAELVGAPGGVNILKTEIANASRYMAERAAEQARIQAERAAAPVIPAAPPPSPFTPPAASEHSPAAPAAPAMPVIRAVDPPATPPAVVPVVPSTAAPSASASASWLTDSMFGGVPNWLLGVGVLGVAFAMGGGRR